MRAFLHKLAAFIRLKKLEHELWRGKKFRNYCTRIKCHHLAELEQAHNEYLETQIEDARKTIRQQPGAQQGKVLK